jgi:hypothetical protein
MTLSKDNLQNPGTHPIGKFGNLLWIPLGNLLCETGWNCSDTPLDTRGGEERWFTTIPKFVYWLPMK